MLIATLKHLRAVVASLIERDIDWLTLDSETVPRLAWANDKNATLIHPRMRINIFSFCYKGESYSVPDSVFDVKYPTLTKILDALRPLIEFLRKNKRRVIIHNANYDVRVFQAEEVDLLSVFIWDTMIGSWMSDGNEDKSLKARAPRYGRHQRDTKTINPADIDDMADYAEQDVVVADEIFQMQVFHKVIRPKKIRYVNEDGTFSSVDNPMPDLILKDIPGETLTDFDQAFLRYQEFPVLRATIRAENNGICIDWTRLKAISEAIDAKVTELQKHIFRQAGKVFNLNSGAQLGEVMHKFGIHSQVKTKSGAESWNAESLFYLKGKHPIVDRIQEYRKVIKLQSTYTGEDGYEFYRNPKTDRIHCNLNTTGAVTGRFSCVAGDTLLHTSRGVFPIEEYLPEEGDTICTHTGEDKPILRKIFKGHDLMYRVTLRTGQSILCTKDHRVYSEDSWKSLAELTVGDKVWAYEYFKEGYSREIGASTSDVPVGDKTNYSGSLPTLRGSLSYSDVDHTRQLEQGGVSSREGSSILAQQTRSIEPYAGQEWFPTPQLQGGHLGRTRVYDEEGEREVCFCSPSGDSGEAWSSSDSTRICGTPHRREQNQQPTLESGSMPCFRTSGVTCKEVEISEITPVGTMGVWDIEVADNHSYQAQGFLNHNSSNPNLQNVPARADTFGIRDVFVAPKGKILICLDFSQIELRIMAQLSQDPVMMKVLNDPKGDIHQASADGFHVPRDPIAKQCNFLLIFGGGAYVLSKGLTLAGAPTDESTAQKYIDGFDSLYVRPKEWRQEMLVFHRQHGFVPLLSGRRRVIEGADSESRYELHRAETQMANNIVQGSAQDQIKASIVRNDPKCINPDAAVLRNLDVSREHKLKLRDMSARIEKLRRIYTLAKLEWHLQVHDEVLYSVDPKAAHEVSHHIAEVMGWPIYWEPIMDLNVIIRADGGIGPTWKSAKKPKEDSLKVHPRVAPFTWALQ